MYRIRKQLIKKTRYNALWEYFDYYSRLTKNLRNATLFRMRQNFTSKGKDKLTENEEQVINEIKITLDSYENFDIPNKVISWQSMDKIMRANHNPDYFSGIPMQSAQEILKDVYHDFKGWLEALKRYKKDPSSFNGKPQMPKYIKSDKYKITFTNQDCVIYPYKNSNGYYLKLPKTKLRLNLGNIPVGDVLKEIQVIPFYGDYQVILIFESSDIINNNPDMPYIASLDLGVDNLATLVTNAGIPAVVYKGRPVKSCNQWYNKRISELKSILMKGHNPKTYHCLTTKQMKSLSRYRDCFINDYFHKTAKDIVRRLISSGCGTLVVGVNKGWKQKTNIGRYNNQNFILIPHHKFCKILEYLCERNGIKYLEQEESYTSKASLLDGDYIPVYGKDDDNLLFSGKRIKRGMYRSKEGIIINADVNGAGNILRKAFPDAFNLIDVKILIKSDTVSFKELYIPKKKRNPIKRIEAV